MTGSRGIPISRRVVVASALWLGACSDFALEADRTPTTLELAPHCVEVASGSPVQLEVVAKDQHDSPMPIPSWAQIDVRVSDPSVADVGSDLKLSAKGAGTVVVTASLGEISGQATFHVDSEPLTLSAPLIYLTQAAQNADNTTRLIAGREALLRVFMTADRSNSLSSGIRVTLLNGGSQTFDTISASAPAGIPTEVDESSLEGSYNVEIPGEHIRAGTSMAIELDPGCGAPAAPGSQRRYPPNGTVPIDVVAPQKFRQVFVPTLMINNPDYSVFDWLDGIGPETDQMHLTRNLMPVADMEVEVRDTLWTSANLFSFGGWLSWLNEIQALNLQEGRRGYYYGVIGRPLTGLLGLANFAVPWSVGVAEASTYTHELGHNMNLRHAPCGGAGGPDPNFPHGNGRIGVWGYDADNRVLKSPSGFRDIMTYCDPVWISDYHFDRATTHRLAGDAGVNLGGAFLEHRDVLVVWGSVHGGRLGLDPAILLHGPVEMPTAPGPYTVEGLGPGGERKFAFSFAPNPLDHGDGGTFVYFVPYDPEWARGLERMTLTGPEGTHELRRGDGPAIAVATHPQTGAIKAIVRDWDGSAPPVLDGLEVTVSTGLPGPGGGR